MASPGSEIKRAKRLLASAVKKVGDDDAGELLDWLDMCRKHPTKERYRGALEATMNEHGLDTPSDELIQHASLVFRTTGLGGPTEWDVFCAQHRPETRCLSRQRAAVANGSADRSGHVRSLTHFYEGLRDGCGVYGRGNGSESPSGSSTSTRSDVALSNRTSLVPVDTKKPATSKKTSTKAGSASSGIASITAPLLKDTIMTIDLPGFKLTKGLGETPAPAPVFKSCRIVIYNNTGKVYFGTSANNQDDHKDSDEHQPNRPGGKETD